MREGVQYSGSILEPLSCTVHPLLNGKHRSVQYCGSKHEKHCPCLETREQEPQASVFTAF